MHNLEGREGGEGVKKLLYRILPKCDGKQYYFEFFYQVFFNEVVLYVTLQSSMYVTLQSGFDDGEGKEHDEHGE